MAPFHAVHLAAHKLTVCRQRVQQDTCGHRDRRGNPLFEIRRIDPHRLTHTDKQKTKLDKTLAAYRGHAAVEITACYYRD